MHGGLNSSKALIALDLQNNPLGSVQGEANLQSPFNAVQQAPRVYVVNHSATVKRRWVKVAVSGRRGAREALAADPSLRKDFTPQSIYDEVRGGQDMNVYVEGIKPVVLKMEFNGRSFFISPAECEYEYDKDKNIVKVVRVIKEAQLQLVPEGLWDLYLGNYARMRSTKQDERSHEHERIAVAWTQRYNPALIINDDGEKQTRNNPFGYVEFIRVIEREAPEEMNRDFVTAMELAEV
jgi:hypothetical protein